MNSSSKFFLKAKLNNLTFFLRRRKQQNKFLKVGGSKACQGQNKFTFHSCISVRQRWWTIWIPNILVEKNWSPKDDGWCRPQKSQSDFNLCLTVPLKVSIWQIGWSIKTFAKIHKLLAQENPILSLFYDMAFMIFQHEIW